MSWYGGTEEGMCSKVMKGTPRRCEGAAPGCHEVIERKSAGKSQPLHPLGVGAEVGTPPQGRMTDGTGDVKDTAQRDLVHCTPHSNSQHEDNLPQRRRKDTQPHT